MLIVVEMIVIAGRDGPVMLLLDGRRSTTPSQCDGDAVTSLLLLFLKLQDPFGHHRKEFRDIFIRLGRGWHENGPHLGCQIFDFLQGRRSRLFASIVRGNGTGTGSMLFRVVVIVVAV